MQTEKTSGQENASMIIKSLVFIFFSTLVIQNIMLFVSFDKLIPFEAPESLKIFSLFVTQELIFISPLLYFIKYREFKLKELKVFNKKAFSLSKAVSSIIGAYLVFFSIMIFLNVLVSHYGIKIPGFGTQMEHLELFGTDKYSFGVSFLSLILIAPIIEEFIFRGLFQTLLRRTFSAKTSIIFSALIFSTIHFEFEVIIPLFILGLIIGWLYEHNKGLLIPIVFHIINNGMAFLFEFLAK